MCLKKERVSNLLKYGQKENILSESIYHQSLHFLSYFKSGTFTDFKESLAMINFVEACNQAKTKYQLALKAVNDSYFKITVLKNIAICREKSGT